MGRGPPHPMNAPLSTPSTLTLQSWFRVIAGCLLLLVCVFIGRQLWQDWRELQRARQGEVAVAHLRLSLMAAQALASERGPTSSLLQTAEDGMRGRRWLALHQARQSSDAAMQQLKQAMRGSCATPNCERALREAEAVTPQLQDTRRDLDALLHAAANQTSLPPAWHHRLQALVDLPAHLGALSVALMDQAQQADNSLLASVSSARLAQELRDHAGQIATLYGPALIRHQSLTPQELASLYRLEGQVDALHHLLLLRVAQEPPNSGLALSLRNMDQQYFGSGQILLADLQVAQAGSTSSTNAIGIAEFTNRYEPLLTSIDGVRDALLNQAQGHSVETLGRLRRALAETLALGLILLAAIVAMLVTTRRRYIQPLAEAAQVLQVMGRGERPTRMPQVHGQDEIAAIVGGIEALRRQQERHAALEAERDHLIASLREQSSTDFLTGLPNRRAFFEAGEAEMARAMRHGYDVAVMLMDIDRFKSINDAYGHAIGDQALVAVANMLRKALRQGDVVGRLGGEEFVALLSHCTPEDSLALAERLRESVHQRALHLGHNLPAVHVSVSIGLAESGKHGHKLEQLLGLADAAMYRAKAAGRNCTQVAAA